jgi:hypothetical protein
MVQEECYAAAVIFSSTSAMSQRATDRAPVMLNASSPILPTQRSQWPLDVVRSEKTCARQWPQEMTCWTNRR